MDIKLKGLWTESYQHIDQKVVKKLTRNHSVASILNTAFTALSLVGFFFYRLFGPRSEASVSQPLDSSRVSVQNTTQQSPTIIVDLQDRLERNRADAEKQQKGQKSTGFEVAYFDVPDVLTWRESPLKSHAKLLDGYSIGVSECQGERETMEDAELATEGVLSIKGQEFSFKLFGIFDGHSKDGIAGAQASKFVADNFLSTLSAQLNVFCADKLTDDGIFKALKETFKKIDTAYTGEGGSTGTVALILGNDLWVANAGDSRTIFVKSDGSIVQASEDAKPEDYKEKIEKLGGKVIKGRVQTDALGKDNDLGVARGFGDHEFGCISANPKITKFALSDIAYIILACDGLYDVASTDEVGAAIREMHHYVDEDRPDHKIRPEEMAKRLAHTAARMGTKDNLSATVIKTEIELQSK